MPTGSGLTFVASTQTTQRLTSALRGTGGEAREL